MKAMILAAGLGTRLAPLTHTKPKALVEVRGRPLLVLVIQRLREQGCNEIIVNAHHLAEQIVAFVRRHPFPDVRLQVSLEDQLLGTGGGLQKAAWFFDDGQPFVVHNVDVLSDLDLGAMRVQHQGSGALASLAVRQRSTTRYLLFDSQGRLCGWQSLLEDKVELARTPQGELTPLSFMGIQVVSPAIFGLFKEQGPFSIITAYLRLAAAGECIQAFRGDAWSWLDVGRRENLAKAEQILRSGLGYGEPI